MTNVVYDELIKQIPGTAKMTPKSWQSFNAVCCMNNGESRPDRRKRGGIRLTPEGTLIYHCFNCGYKAIYKPGDSLSNKMKNVMKWMGCDPDRVQEISFNIWRDREKTISETGEIVPKKNFIPHFEVQNLPEKSSSIMDILETETDKNFIDVVKYLLVERGEDIFYGHKYYWSPDKSVCRSVIVPFYWDNKIVGFTTRKIDPTINRYWGITPNNYLFNNKAMYLNRKYLIIVEGVFDAIALDGVGIMRNNLTHQQLEWISSCNKEIILVPDRVKNGWPSVSLAIQQKWNVALPEWEEDVKDVADAVKKYGKLYTLASIMESKTTDALKINVNWKNIVNKKNKRKVIEE